MVEELQKKVHDLSHRVDIDEHLIADLQTQGAVERSKVENLRAALTTSRRIGAAIGILMANYKLTEDSAFEVLRRASNTSQRKLRDIAEDVVRTGALPPPPWTTT